MGEMNSTAHEAESLTARIAMWSARHRKAIALGWLLIVVLSIATCSAVPANTDLRQTAPGEAGRAFKLIQERFHVTSGTAQEIVVFSSRDRTVDDSVYKQTVQGLMDQLASLRWTQSDVVGGTRVVSSRRIVSGTTTYYDVGAPRGQSPFVAKKTAGGDVSFALVSLEGEATEAAKHIQPMTDAVATAQQAANGFTILEGGDASVSHQSEDVVNQDLQRSLLLNLVVTTVILLLVFGTVVAALVPLSLAFAAIITATGILTLVSQKFPLNQIYTEMVLLMGLATGIDYALFVITRYRRERSVGKSNEQALRVATATSGKAVVFAGSTVVLAICGMFLVGDDTFSSLGLAAVVVVVLAIITSVTLLPALLALLGDNIVRMRLPFLGGMDDQSGGIWGFITDRVMARPAIIAGATIVLLLALASPILTLNLGFNGAKSLPADLEAKKALLALQENFTLGLTSPALVVVTQGTDTNVFDPDVQSRVGQLMDLVKAETASSEKPVAPYGLPIQTQINDAGDTEIIRIPINADTGDQKGIDALNHLRHDLIPSVFANGPAKAEVTGATAANIDFRHNIVFRTPFVFAFVLGLAFLILLLAFRSIVVAVKAIILNLLSVGATYGLLVLVFQRGWGLERVLSFSATGIIESWLPLFLFAILFGLSMDYHMFVLGRVKEAYERGESSRNAVSIGIKATASTITSAAAIMVAVALIFAFTREIGLKQFGFGLATAILIDATVVRSILLPASMELLGDANWYLPRWLRWLPEIKMGE